MGFNPLRAFHLLARIGRPLARILGLRKGTVADKAIEVVEVLDPLIPQGEKSTTQKTKP